MNARVYLYSINRTLYAFPQRIPNIEFIPFPAKLNFYQRSICALIFHLNAG